MKTLICVPCLNMVNVEFCSSIANLIKLGDCEYAFHSNSLVYDARNILAHMALNGGFSHVLWLDSDMMFDQMTLAKLTAAMGDDKDIVSGIYFRRVPGFEPCIYKEAGDKLACYTDFPAEGTFEVAGAGLGCCLMKTAVLAMISESGEPFDIVDGYGEDLSFFNKVRAAGIKIYATNDVKPRHIGVNYYGEEHFRAYAERNNKADQQTG